MTTKKHAESKSDAPRPVEATTPPDPPDPAEDPKPQNPLAPPPAETPPQMNPPHFPETGATPAGEPPQEPKMAQEEPVPPEAGPEAAQMDALLADGDEIRYWQDRDKNDNPSDVQCWLLKGGRQVRRIEGVATVGAANAIQDAFNARKGNR